MRTDATRRVEQKRRHAAALQDASAVRAGEFEFGLAQAFDDFIWLSKPTHQCASVSPL